MKKHVIIYLYINIVYKYRMGTTMFKKFLSLAAALTVAFSVTGCGGKTDHSSDDLSFDSHVEFNATRAPKSTAVPDNAEEVVTQVHTENVSLKEIVTSSMGTQTTPDKIIERTEGKNTVLLPLSDFIEDGDDIQSFTFIIYSPDDRDIGEFKGGCGIAVNNSCPVATNDGWYQSEDFSAPTQGKYGEITWNVPDEIKDYISTNGKVLFGYWWGNTESIRLDSVVCTYTRTKEIPVDGALAVNVGQSVRYDSDDKFIRFSAKDQLPDDAVIQAVTYNISGAGTLGKFTGAFGCERGESKYQSPDSAVFTNDSKLSLTWILPDRIKKFARYDSELSLGYWWSQQDSVTLDSVMIKYSTGAPPEAAAEETTERPEKVETGFRSTNEILREIKVGWNLGNSLESYNTENTGLDTETGWGNPKATADMIKNVRKAGFNAIRIPVTWGEHMDGDTIQPEWLGRVKEVVDYAFSENMYVIINMHHDDYIWFNPTDAEYENDSKRLKAIWKQIAEYFADYDDHLIFEGMNEPRTIGSNNEWTGGTSAERDVINRYAKDFVNTVRNTGGSNQDRTLLVTTYAASAEVSAMQDMEIPKDDHIALSLHYYAPWKFSSGKSTSFGASETGELDAKFAKIKQMFVDKGVPVVITEFGCVAAADDQTRADYFNYYISAANTNGIKCFIWDNGQLAGGEDSFGIFRRNDLTWNNTILDGIMKGAL